MIIIQLAGGLGNQMFQYALYLQLKSLGREVKIDDVTGFAQDAQRDPALQPFGIAYERPGVKEMEQMLDSSMLPWHRVRRKLCGRKKKAYFEADKRYHPEIMTWDDIYLEGYWQTEKYFEKIADQVREVYDTDKLLHYIRKRNEDSAGADAATQRKYVRIDEWLDRIAATESVSLHVRRGDYLLPENQALFGGICTEAYYRRAVEQMRQEYPNCQFYLFTNDKQWARDMCAGRMEVVDVGEQEDYAEFLLMSRCRHHILANSSFGWWASYLNKYQGKTILAPDRWLNGWDCTDFYREDMHRIPTEKGNSHT